MRHELRIQDITDYKYMLLDPCSFYVGIFPNGQFPCVLPYTTLLVNGHLCFEPGFLYDGASCAIDSKNFMVPAMVHDAGYRFIRNGLLPLGTRRAWDDLLDSMCNERGMTGLRRSWVHLGVRVGGGRAIDPAKAKQDIRIIRVS